MLQVVTIVVTPFAQNCRVLFSTDSRRAVVVDPGGDVARIAKVIKDYSLNIESIWLTHSHLDHCGGVAELKSMYNVPLYAHPVEREMRAHVREICAAYGLPAGDMQNCPEPEVAIEGGEKLGVGEETVDVLFTPGHSPGHVCFYHPGSSTLIAGDTLFASSIGRTDLPGGDYDTLISSIRNVILSLPDATRVLPGHGPDTTVAEERDSNPFLV